MAKDKIHMPTSTAGLTRYFDDYTSRITFKPGHVIILCLIVAILVILFNVYGGALLGF